MVLKNIAMVVVCFGMVHYTTMTVFHLQEVAAKHKQTIAKCDQALAFMAQYAEPQVYYSEE